MKKYIAGTSQFNPSEELIESPFLNQKSFAGDKPEQSHEMRSLLIPTQTDSPFRSVYEMEGQEDMDDPETEEFAGFLSELYDEEFNETLFEIMNEAADFYQSQSTSGFSNQVSQEAEAGRLLEEHFATPLNREIEKLFDNIVQAFENVDPQSMSEAEIDSLLDEVELNHEFSPQMEHFGWGGLKKAFKTVNKKARRYIKKGLSYAKKRLLKPALNKLKSILEELIKKVLKKAINKLPVALRPPAIALRKKYLRFELVENENFEFEELHNQNIAEIQHEFDLQVANLLFAQDDTEEDVAISAYVSESNQTTENPINQLEHARARFIHEIIESEEGEDVTPYVENFAPAIIAAAKLAIKFIGRDKVITYLARPINSLANRYVPKKFKKYNWPLSKALANVGLKYLKLEVTPEEEAEAAASSIAAVVENTVHQVAKLPEYILDDKQMLESYVLDAFEQAVAKNLPQVLPENIYVKRPELRETWQNNGTWVMLPLCGKKYYKKYTKVFDTTISPQIAKTITTFGRLPLATYLRDQYGLSASRGIKARVHLYEAIPGSRFSQISKNEAGVQGLGTTDGWSQFHPLTPKVAGLLTGEAGLGQFVNEFYLAQPQMIDDMNGQRFYYLEIDGARPQLAVAPDGAVARKRSTEVNLTMDFSNNQLRVYIFLSEADAQEIAAGLRQHAATGFAMKHAMSALKNGLQIAFLPGMHHRIKIMHTAVIPGYSQNIALKKLSLFIRERFTERLINWVGLGLSGYFLKHAQEFVASTNNEIDGVTIAASIQNPPGYEVIRQMLKDGTVKMNNNLFTQGIPDTSINVIPGFHRE